MSARRDNESPIHHRGGSNGGLGFMPMPPPMPPANMVGLMPPVVLAPPPPLMMPPSAPRPLQPPRFAPSDHASPEVTQPHNPLQQLMYQHQQDAQSFLHNFLSNSQSHAASHAAPPPMAPTAPPLHLLTPPPYANRSLPPPPLPQTMQLSMPSTSTSSSIGSYTRSPDDSALPSTPRQDGPAPGRRIYGDHYEYRVRDGQQTTAAQLEVTPVTMYTSQRRVVWGNMIAVNDQFISYPIRNGLIRLLGQSSADRLLLREHENRGIADIACFAGRADLLLTAGTDGKIFVFHIATDPMSYEVVKELHTPVQRAIWHPFDVNRIAVVSEGTVFVTELNLVPSSAAEGPTDMQQYSVRCAQTPSQINDVVFSPCGRFLVTGGMDGFVHIYSLEGCAAGDAAELLHRFEPFDGGEVWSVRFYGGQDDAALGLLVGGDANSKLSLWQDPLSDGTQPTCVQTVKIVHDGSESSSSEPVMYDVVFDPSAQFLFVTDRTRPLLFVLHLNSSSSRQQGRARRFDNITEFNVTHPVLSASIVNRQGSSETGLMMQFFTVQVHAIQRYNVSSDRCYRVGGQDEDEDEDEDDEINESEGAGQSVGALTTEGEGEAVSFQAPSESPRATAAAPETELDLQTPQQNGDDESEYTSTQASAHLSPAGSPRRTFFAGGGVPHIAVDTSSLAGEDAGGSVRSYARSSPSSSVRAFRDDTSQLGEVSVDESVSTSNQIMDYLRRLEVGQLQREEQQRAEMQRMMHALAMQVTMQAAAQVEKTIQKQMQTILVPAMGRIVLHTMENNFMKPVQAGFERAISERLIPQMEAKMNESLETTLPDQMQAGVSDMVDRVVEEVRQPVRESFKECFRDIIIPSFQAATQKMFEQIHDHVLKGGSQTRSNVDNSEISMQLKQLTSLVDGLSRKVDQLQLGGGNNNGSYVQEEETLTQEQRQEATLLEFVRAGDYEEAFKYALGAQSIPLVAFACEQCDPRDVLSTRPPKLSQMIILCLVQQLGVDLSAKLPLKITWLQQALLVMDPRDAAIVGFVGTVLQETKANLDLVPEAERDSQYTLLHHVLNSLLSQV